MDIMTLNAVIIKLQKQVDYCHEMQLWCIKKYDGTCHRDVDMWTDAKVEAKRCLEIVENMLTEELAVRDQEVA